MNSWIVFGVCLLFCAGAITSSTFTDDSEFYRTNSTNSTNTTTTTARPPCNSDSSSSSEENNSGECSSPTPSRNRCSGQPDDTLFPSLNDCAFFVTCQGGLEMELECRPEGTLFDHERQVCDHPENVECYSPDRCEEEEDGSVIPAEDNCSQFHICTRGKKSDLITCVPDGTLFDYVRGVCDHPENVQCYGQEPPSTESTTEGSGTTLEPTRPPLPEGIPSDICRGIVIDILPHPDNCIQFVVCVLGQPSVDNCPPDYIFYPQIGVCGYGNTETCDIDPRWLEDYLREQERLEMMAMSG